ncbi:furin-like protease kpc-1 [Eurytemora carolleeae]|uniref:furin-like protease kpc-1 n=1 Tax=Eurytemora carolleeae TaxID=1294199 RepID=UPI000C756196|nr:furin-like protease kpc-1 [Eurytemora carolleeae]|eukprot:XP_023326698.1 furin-like protease kpc-1 [Eurytemora affinis]
MSSSDCMSSSEFINFKKILPIVKMDSNQDAMVLLIYLVSMLHLTTAELEWAVHVKGGREAADKLAQKHDLLNLGEIIPETDYYLLKTRDNSRRKRSIRDLSDILKNESDVDWSEFQAPKERVKRVPLSNQILGEGIIGPRLEWDPLDPAIKDSMDSSTSTRDSRDPERDARDPDRDARDPERDARDPIYASNDPFYKFERRLVENLLPRRLMSEVNDPGWEQMWYLNRRDSLTMNVQGAWNLGVTGLGVAVTILDDGIEKDHPDLIRNYDPLSSTDINDGDSDPNPRYDFSDSNRHGTRCAGQVAATPNNSLCAIGIAFNAQIGGIRMLDGQVSDAVEARSLSFNPDHIHIYSASWGPNDDGKTVDGPGKLATRAFQQGIFRGRDGLGSIFVWASGNGGRYKDNCNCDGYATSIFTITVSSTSEGGSIPWYSEPCSATIATTYSSGTATEKQIVTTDLHHKCTTKHTGTSASAPMAAAIIALTLEANPSLTWRDVQHIMVRTARPGNLQAPDWKLNGVGRKVSHNYGYGLMDAEAMVRLSRRWITTPAQGSCEVVSPYYYKVIQPMSFITIELDVLSCPGVRFLEHVVSPIHVTAGRKRGDLRIYLMSPSKTRSTLLHNRPSDFSSSGFTNWPFMTTHSWGESPLGKWTLEIHNDAYSSWVSESKFFRWSLKLYGTRTDPNSDKIEDHEEWYDEREEVEETDWKLNVVREAPLESTTTPVSTTTTSTKTTTTSSKTTSTTTTTGSTTTKSGFRTRGCISNTLECTKNVSDCRMFEHRKVAGIFCHCIPGTCIGVAFSRNQFGDYNLQCNVDSTPRLSNPPPPFYCQFIPFFQGKKR